jgi:hypothetical protein
MNGWRALDLIFPYIEKLTPAEQAVEDQRLERDIAAIEAADYTLNDERALDEAQKVSATEIERVRTAEGKATTYLAVLAALVPVIITLQAANWEKKAGPAPDAARLFVLAVATIYIAAAGYHAFKTLQVAGFQRVGEAEIAAAWRTLWPLRKLTRGTLLATRRSRDAVNAKITRIRVTHEHLLRAFGTFVLLLLLDPLFYAMGFRNAAQEPPPSKVIAVERNRPALPPRKNLPAPGGNPSPVKPSHAAQAIGQQPVVTKLSPAPARKLDCPEHAKECVRLN